VTKVHEAFRPAYAGETLGLGGELVARRWRPPGRGPAATGYRPGSTGGPVTSESNRSASWMWPGPPDAGLGRVAGSSDHAGWLVRQEPLLQPPGRADDQQPGRLALDHPAVLDPSRDEDERPGWRERAPAVHLEGELAFEHVDQLVVPVVDVARRRRGGRFR
jgi:hypothetical protein